MKNLICSLLFLGTFSLANAQNVEAARRWFNMYEYEKAAVSYELTPRNWNVSHEDKQMWCYAHFITSNYQKAFRLADTMLLDAATPAYFHYVHGYASMALGNYPQAIESFEKYKVADDEIFVDSLIASCQAIPSFPSEKLRGFSAFPINHSKADYPGAISPKGLILFHESGRDGQKMKTVEFVDDADLLQMQPVLYTDGEKIELKLPEQMALFNVSSIAFDEDPKNVFITLNNPIDSDPKARYHRLFQAEIKDNQFVNINLWEHAAGEAFASGHATINEAKNLMVFTAQSNTTSGSDLYMSRKVGGKWQRATAITQLNTKDDELYPKFAGDTALIFSSNGRVGLGGYDLYAVSVDAQGNFGTVRHFKSPINSFADDYNLLYFPSGDSAIMASNRRGGKGDDDIYTLVFPPKPIIEKPVVIEEIPFIQKWSDIVIYFQFDKFKISDESKRLITELKDNYLSLDEYQIIVEGNTDRRGDKRYNYQLALKRANQVKAEMVKIGIDANVINVISLGDTAPAIDCGNGCSESEHALNRFVAIKLVRNL